MMNNEDLIIARIVPTNTQARSALLAAAKEVQEHEDHRKLRHYIKSEDSIDYGGDPVGHTTSLSPSSIMIALSLEESRHPQHRPLGWRMGRAGSDVDVGITASSQRDFHDVNFRIFIHPKSGRLILVTGTREDRIQYLDAKGISTHLRPDQSLLILDRVTSIIFDDGRSFDIRTVNVDQLLASHWVSFIRRTFGHDLHPAGKKALSQGLTTRPEYGYYAVGENLGAGSYGDVWYAVDRRTGAHVALKQVRIASKTWRREIRDEIKIQSKFQNVENIVYLIEAWCGDHVSHPDFCRSIKVHYYMAQPLGLFDLSTKEKLSELSYGIVLELFRQILLALKHIHKEGVMHRDVTLNNMIAMQVAPPRAALADFGKSIDNLQSSETRIGPIPYCAPEVWTGVYTHAVDAWFWAISIAVHLGWAPPPEKVDSQISEETLQQVRQTLEIVRQRKPEVELLVDLLLGILKWDQSERYTIDQALAHSVWLRSPFEDEAKEADIEESLPKRPRLPYSEDAILRGDGKMTALPEASSWSSYEATVPFSDDEEADEADA